MYIESINSSVPINAAVGASAAVPASTTRPVTQTDTDNSVRVETTDGENTQTQGNPNSGKANDTRTSEEMKSADNEKIKKAIEKMNAQLPNSEVKFGIHEKTDRVTIKIIDKDTKEDRKSVV